MSGIYTERELEFEGEILQFKAVYLGEQGKVFKIATGGSSKEESFRRFFESFRVEK